MKKTGESGRCGMEGGGKEKKGGEKKRKEVRGRRDGWMEGPPTQTKAGGQAQHLLHSNTSSLLRQSFVFSPGDKQRRGPASLMCVFV